MLSFNQAHVKRLIQQITNREMGQTLRTLEEMTAVVFAPCAAQRGVKCYLKYGRAI